MKSEKAVFKLDAKLVKRVDALLKTPRFRDRSFVRSDIYREALVEYLAAREAPVLAPMDPAPRTPKPSVAPKPYAPGPKAP